MRNRDWLNNMALIDMLSYISDHIDECLVYHIENRDFEKQRIAARSMSGTATNVSRRG